MTDPTDPAQEARPRISFAVAIFGFSLLLFAIHDCDHALAAEPRARAPITAFRATHPCPSTGKTTGKCPGFVADHAVPLCWDPKGDRADNLIWQDIQQSYRKDVFERAACALRKKLAGCKS